VYENDLLEVIRQAVNDGTPYIGWSAGANLACPTIMTTNDMPIVEPPTLKALNLIPVQINPHYHELSIPGHAGETRPQRLEEFLIMNPGKRVLGLPEGMLLECTSNGWILKGSGTAILYEAAKTVRAMESGQRLDDWEGE
jgi:dipeptidase E